MKYTIVFLALFVFACQSANKERALLLNCQAYKSILVSLAGLKISGALSPSEINTVDEARAVLNPICENLDVAQAETVQDLAFHLLEIERAKR